MKHYLTQEYLKEALTYNESTGIFTWNKRPISHFKSEKTFKIFNNRFSGCVAGYMNKLGYIYINLKNKDYLAHRLAFLYIHGYIPENEVDHIDRNSRNNKIDNLREVSHQCNLQNCKQQKNNTSGITGVYYSSKKRKWIAQIKTVYKVKYLGIFENKIDAAMARYKGEIENNYLDCSSKSSAKDFLILNGVQIPKPEKIEEEC